MASGCFLLFFPAEPNSTQDGHADHHHRGLSSATIYSQMATTPLHPTQHTFPCLIFLCITSCFCLLFSVLSHMICFASVCFKMFWSFEKTPFFNPILLWKVFWQLKLLRKIMSRCFSLVFLTFLFNICVSGSKLLKIKNKLVANHSELFSILHCNKNINRKEKVLNHPYYPGGNMTEVSHCNAFLQLLFCN